MNIDIDFLSCTNEVKRFERFITENSLIAKNDRVMVALSGGADSVSLLIMLLCIKQKYGLDIEAFHLNHMIRAEAGIDEEFCVKLCDALKVKLNLFKEDIPKLAKQLGVSEETAGRSKRYDIMEKFRQMGFNKAATAHHADDNAETVIMRLIRGSGITGLCAIAPLRDGYIMRPLLCFTKRELTGFLARNNIEYVTDMTNFENDYFRNRVRNVIMPLLHAENANFAENIFRLSQTARDYCDMADKFAANVELTIGNDGGVSMEICEFYEMPSAVRYTLLKKMCAMCGSVNDIGSESLRALDKLIFQRGNTVWDYPLHGVNFLRRYQKLTAEPLSEKKVCEAFEYPIGKTGLFIFPRLGFALRLELAKKNKKNSANRHITYLDYDKITNNIKIRSRKEKDRFAMIGLNGTKSVKKLFIDRKVAKEARDKVPLILSGDDIAAVIGYETAEGFKVKEYTKNMLIIEYIEL